MWHGFTSLEFFVTKKLVSDKCGTCALVWSKCGTDVLVWDFCDIKISAG